MFAVMFAEAIKEYERLSTKPLSEIHFTDMVLINVHIMQKVCNEVLNMRVPQTVYNRQVYVNQRPQSAATGMPTLGD